MHIHPRIPVQVRRQNTCLLERGGIHTDEMYDFDSKTWYICVVRVQASIKIKIPWSQTESTFIRFSKSEDLGIWVVLLKCICNMNVTRTAWQTQPVCSRFSHTDISSLSSGSSTLMLMCCTYTHTHTHTHTHTPTRAVSSTSHASLMFSATTVAMASRPASCAGVSD